MILTVPETWGDGEQIDKNLPYKINSNLAITNLTLVGFIVVGDVVGMTVVGLDVVGWGVIL